MFISVGYPMAAKLIVNRIDEVFMKVLKSKLSGYYFKGFGVWTTDPLDAFTFTNEWVAREFMRRERVEDVQVADRDVIGPVFEAAA